MNTTKTCLLILEAVEPRLLKAGIERGDLPNLARLCESGRQGDVHLLPGVGANALWPSLYTGLPPQAHGRFYHQQLEDGDYTVHSSHQTSSLVPPFWAALAESGCKVLILDPPKAPPPSGAELCHVSGWRSHFSYQGEETVHPAQVAAELARAGLQTRECPCIRSRFTHSVDQDVGALTRSAHEDILQSRDLILNRIHSGDWNLLVAGLCAGHCAGHQLWHCHDPTYSGCPEDTANDPLHAVYRALDDALGDIVGKLPRDTTLAVFAGPGMGPGHVHPALMGELLEALDPPSPQVAGQLRRQMTKLWRRLPSAWRQRLLSAGHWADQRLQQADYSQRPCFPVRSNDNIGGLRINLKGREEHGCVTAEEYPVLLDRLANLITQMRNAETGEPLVTCALKTREHYPGGEMGAMPDLLVEWNERAPVRTVTGPGLPPFDVTYPPQWSGAHNQHAMLILRESGNTGVHQAGTLPTECSVLDIAATLNEACGGASTLGEGRSLLA
jgi:predicted AlkP superfamily phosphohydrolase/phosphomutase